MSSDVKMFNACDHIVNNKTYHYSLCPRCYGKGYYLDIHFDLNGEAVLTDGEIKLQQDMLKVILDQKYNNLFYKNWGSELNNVIGSKNMNINKAKLEVIVRSALEYLKNVQIDNKVHFKNSSESEILEKIEFIEIETYGPTGYNVKVTISNKIGQIFEQSITL